MEKQRVSPTRTCPSGIPPSSPGRDVKGLISRPHATNKKRTHAETIALVIIMVYWTGLIMASPLITCSERTSCRCGPRPYRQIDMHLGAGELQIEWSDIMSVLIQHNKQGNVSIGDRWRRMGEEHARWCAVFVDADAAARLLVRLCCFFFYFHARSCSFVPRPDWIMKCAYSRAWCFRGRPQERGSKRLPCNSTSAFHFLLSRMNLSEKTLFYRHTLCNNVFLWLIFLPFHLCLCN